MKIITKVVKPKLSGININNSLPDYSYNGSTVSIYDLDYYNELKEEEKTEEPLVIILKDLVEESETTSGVEEVTKAESIFTKLWNIVDEVKNIRNKVYDESKKVVNRIFIGGTEIRKNIDSIIMGLMEKKERNKIISAKLEDFDFGLDFFQYKYVPKKYDGECVFSNEDDITVFAPLAYATYENGKIVYKEMTEEQKKNIYPKSPNIIMI